MCKIGDIIAVPNFVGGQVDGDVLIKLLQRMQYLDTKGKLKQNIENIRFINTSEENEMVSNR